MSPLALLSRGAPRTRTRTSGLTRAREARRRRRLLGLGSAAIVIAFALMYVAIKSPTGIPLKPYYNVTARFNTVGTLETGAEVTVAGKLVGQVVDLRRVSGTPEVDLQMDPGTRLPVGTTARIRPRGLLGAEYVDLRPSRSRQMIRNGGVIPTAQTSSAEQLTDVIAGLTAPARAHLQGLINGLGEGLLGRGPELNQTLSTAPSTLTNLRHAVTPLVHSDGIRTLISGADSVTGALLPVRSDFFPGLHFGARALAPLEAEYGSVSRLLEQAPAEITSIDASLHTTDTVLRHVSTFAQQTTRFAALAPRALHSLTAVLVDRRPLGSARTLLTKLGPAISPTEAATRALNPELPHLSGLFDELTPVLRTLGPYGCDLEGFAANWRGFLGHGVAGQSGPLGPYTSISLVLAAPEAEIGSQATLPTSYDADPVGCAGTPGASR